MKSPHRIAPADASTSLQLGSAPNTGLDETAREGVVRLLTNTLADAFVLHTKARSFHWNVTGPQFFELHAFFERQYEETGRSVDEIAERIRALGGRAIGTLAELLRHARLKESGGDTKSAAGMLEEFLADNEEVARRLRKDIETCQEEHEDEGTANFLAELLVAHEKTAWMIRSSLDRAADAGEKPLRKAE